MSESYRQVLRHVKNNKYRLLLCILTYRDSRNIHFIYLSITQYFLWHLLKSLPKTICYCGSVCSTEKDGCIVSSRFSTISCRFRGLFLCKCLISQGVLTVGGLALRFCPWAERSLLTYYVCTGVVAHCPMSKLAAIMIGCYSIFLPSNSRCTSGVMISSIASPILPPGTTRVLMCEMKEPCSIANR